MSIFSKLFGKKQAEENEVPRVGGMEDFMTLIRVYYQAVMATNIGISNINFLPDMAVFKRTLKIPTQNNKLGIAEKSRCKKMLTEIYGLPDGTYELTVATRSDGDNVYVFASPEALEADTAKWTAAAQWDNRTPAWRRGTHRPAIPAVLAAVRSFP